MGPGGFSVGPQWRRRAESRSSEKGRTMTQLLDKALSEIAKLTASEQDAVAALVLEELASEERWSASFAESQDLLPSLAEDTLAEHATGQTKPL